MLDIAIAQIERITIVESQEDLDAMQQLVNQVSFVLVQNYNHVMRSYKPVCMFQAVQVKDTLYVIDCLKLGYPNVLADRRLLKITSEATPTGHPFEKVIEVNCQLTCRESL